MSTTNITARPAWEDEAVALASRAARSIVTNFEDQIKKTAENSPLRRPITADEVGIATAFLCSPLARTITGQVVYVDSGFSIMGAPPEEQR